MNQMSPDDLLAQVRTAHRLLAAYYQRLLPTLMRIARTADTNFDFWLPQQFSAPGRSDVNQFDKWQWDLLPALTPRYVFKKVEGSAKVTRNDYVLEFIIINDTGIYEQDFCGQPDALNLDLGVTESRSLIQVGVYRAVTDVNAIFFDEWNQVKYPDYSKDGETKKDKNFVVAGFEVPIQMLMDEDGIVHINDKIQRLLELTAEHEQSEQGKVEG
jgi:hypothetical protein